MYAVFENGGKQYRVKSGDVLDLDRLEIPETGKITFDKVLLVGEGESVKVGTPVLSGAQVSAELVRHLRGDKIRVFKMKRRKGYRRTQGHRQELTRVKILEICA